MGLGIEHHVEQGAENACVAACVGMVLRARAMPFDEAALMGEATEAGLSMAVAAQVLGARFSPYLSIEALLAALERLRDGDHAIIVKVSGPRYVQRFGHRPGGGTSRFGRLAEPGDVGGPMHAITLIGVHGESVGLLDPFYPGEGQPLAMLRDDLVRMYAGVAIEVTL